MGRPSEFTQDKADAICLRLADGESLRSICRDDSMPSKTAVLKWLDAHESFAAQYARARAAQADHYADEIADIADDATNDWMERETRDGRIETVIDHEHVQRSKLRIDARKWIASKLAPKKYGDKLELAGNQEQPLTVQVLRLTDGNDPASS